MAQSGGVQYVTTHDGVSVAYIVRGEGYPIIHMQGPPFSHLQLEGTLASYDRYNDAVSKGRRSIRFDSRGSGLSQRGVTNLSIATLTDDLIAIVDRLALERFAICGTQSGGLIALNALKRIPERVSHIAFIDSFANGTMFGDIPQVSGFMALGRSDWDLFTETLAHSFFGWDAGQPARDYARFLRECVNQEEGNRFFDALFAVDMTEMLSTVNIPTVVIHHSRSLIPGMDAARELASRLPKTELVLLQGYWNDLQDDLEVVQTAISRLLSDVTSPATATSGAKAQQGGLVTILFTDIEGSTSLTQRIGDAAAQEIVRAHNEIVREALRAHDGSETKHTGDGIMASFPLASGAIEASIDIQRAVAAHNEKHSSTAFRVRVGLNAGEPVMEDQDMFGTAVQMARRVCDAAEAGTILVTDVVRHLAAGKRFLFAETDETTLRGFEDPVRLYEVKWTEG